MTVVGDPRLHPAGGAGPASNARAEPVRVPPPVAEALHGADRETPRWSSPGYTWYSHTRALMRSITQVSDFLVPLLAIIVIFVAGNRGEMPHGLDAFLELRLTVKNLILLTWFAAIWRLLCAGTGLYDEMRLGTVRREVLMVLAVAAAGAVMAIAFPALSASGAFEYHDLVPFWALTSMMMLLQRAGVRAIVGRSAQDIVIVGTGPRAAGLYEALCCGSRGAVKVLGFVDDEHPLCYEPIRSKRLGTLTDLEQILMRHPVDQVLITLPMRSRYADVQTSIDTCARAGVRAEYLADLFTSHGRAPRFEQGPQFATMAVPVVSEEHWKLFVKRAIDMAGATIGLVVLAPLMVATAVAIKLTSDGPVLFRQDRFGYRKRRFTMYKFRTMSMDAEKRQAALEPLNEAGGPVFKLKADPRLTRIGPLLRRTSIDELPQLVNVLLGDMSLVGPRPLPVRDVGRFTEAALMRRFSVRPGITGLWQVSGRSNLPFETWMQLDLQYIDEWSLGLDCRVILRTFPSVIRGVGAK